MALLELKDVHYTYKTKYQSVEAVRGVTCSFDSGMLYAIMGSSGSGKSTLLSLMAGLDIPTSGEVIMDGVSTADTDLERYRREKAAVIYQNFRLFPLLTVAENIMYPQELRGVKPRDAKRSAAELIGRVQLPLSALDRFPSMLSGGEQQRVAIARALGMNTKLLLADEPTGNLDTANGETVFSLLAGLAREEGYCVIIVTHDPALGERADRLLRLCDGRLV